jgi:hypothetical protein
MGLGCVRNAYIKFENITHRRHSMWHLLQAVCCQRASTEPLTILNDLTGEIKPVRSCPLEYSNKTHFGSKACNVLWYFLNFRREECMHVSICHNTMVGNGCGTLAAAL